MRPYALTQFIAFARQIERLPGLAQNQVVGLALEGIEVADKRLPVPLPAQGIDFLEQGPPVLNPLRRNSAGKDQALDLEIRRVGVPVGGKSLALRSQEARVGKPAQRISQGDVRRQQALVVALEALFESHDGSHGGINRRRRGHGAGGDDVGRGLVAGVRMSEAADEGVLVGLAGQQGQQFTDANARDIGRQGVLERAGILLAGLRLGIKGVDVAGAAAQPDLDDRPGLAGLPFAFGPEGEPVRQREAQQGCSPDTEEVSSVGPRHRC